MPAFNPAAWDDDDAYDAYDDDDDQLRRTWGGKPCVIYVRISHTDIIEARKDAGGDDAEEQALLLAKREAHLARCEAFARRAGLEVKATFREDNMSASALRPRRGGRDGQPGELIPLPQRTALLGYLRALDASIIVLTTELARLYRDSAESQEMIDQGIRFNRMPARPAHLTILDVTENKYDLATDAGRTRFRDDVNRAEAEAKTIGRRRRAKERDRAEDGLYFGRRPFGYTRDTKPSGKVNGRLTVKDGTRDDLAGTTPGANPGVDEAGLIRQAAARIIAEAAADRERSPSCGAIAAQWNAAGVTTARGGAWTGGTVALLLQRPLLAGWRLHLPGSTDGRRPRAPPPPPQGHLGGDP